MREWQSLFHVEWECKYHVVIVPKYRRKIIFGRTVIPPESNSRQK